MRMRSLLQPIRFYVQYEAVKKNDDEGNDAAVPQDQKNVVLKLLMNHHAKKHSSMNIVQYLSSTATASKAFMLYSLYYMLSSFWIILSIALQIYYLGSRFYLYAEYPIDVLSRPWLLVIWFCECLYLCGALFSAVDHLLPPSRRPDLGLLDVTSRRNKQTVSDCGHIHSLLQKAYARPYRECEGSSGFRLPTRSFQGFCAGRWC